MDIPEIPIEGECDPRFLAVKHAFAENFVSRNELGAALCVILDGRTVIDLWGGHVDKLRTRPWASDTLVNVYSTTKGVAALCAHRLVDEGKLELDAPVARYWPAFAQNGKDQVLVRHLLGHQAGLPAIRKPLPGEALFDWTVMTDALAAEEPWWTPGSAHGYHAMTFGWLVGEVVRRVAGKSLGSYFRDELAGPLGLDFHIGLAEKEWPRVSGLRPAPPPSPGDRTLLFEILAKPDGMTARAFVNPPTGLMPGVVASPEWRRAELPAMNGHSTARAIASLYGALATDGRLDGTRVLSKEGIERASTEESHGRDRVLLEHTRFSAGFMLPVPGASFGPNLRAFGHPGMGGSLGFADPEARVGFGYTMNKMGGSILVDDRPASIITALYEALK
jgi:CubicO group peptidase (beta-lactamase class C family)